MGIVIKFISQNLVNRQDQFYTFCFGLHYQVGSYIQFVLLAQGVPDLTTPGFDKGIGHPSPYDQVVNPVQQVLNDLDLIGYFGPSHDGSHGLFRMVQYPVHGFNFFVDQESEHL